MPLGCRFEPRRQTPEGGRVAWRAGEELDGDVDVAGRPERAAPAGPEQQGIGYVWIVLEDAVHVVDHVCPSRHSTRHFP